MKVEPESCFSLLRNVETAHSSQYLPLSGEWKITTEIAPGMFSVNWPNGVPCVLVEMHLAARFHNGAASREVDGGSLRATVSKLIHLVRYCWNKSIDFWELDDDEYHRFICFLKDETKPNKPFVPTRNGNTVRAISASCIDFLRWLQDDLRFKDDLVGHGRAFRVRLKRPQKKSEPEDKGASSAYHRLPPRDTREPKRPMPSLYRNSLWEAAQSMSNVRRNIAGWATESADAALLTDFITSRRELLLYLLEATGARPGEIARLSVIDNIDCYKTRKLKLITLKRRRVIFRVIDIQPDVAMRLEIFIRGYRTALLGRIRQETGSQKGGDRVFIGLHGDPMHERTLTTEFSRIAAHAGLRSVQSCMSMFRHRFITKQVAIHLKEYLSENSLVRALMTEQDYLSILKKVATITGHGSPKSLLHYIDLAWDELGAFDRVQAAQEIEAAVDATATRLISLVGNISKKSRTNSKEIEEAIKALQALRADVQRAISKSTRP